MVVTAGGDNSFKLWKLQGRSEAHRMTKTEDQLTVMWQCTGVGQWREEAPCGADFSRDGTLLAVGYGAVVTLWQPESLTLVGTLPHREPITSIRFIPGSALLAVATAGSLTVWDLLTCSIWWSYAAPVKQLAVHPYRNSLAVLCEFPKTESEEAEQEVAAAAAAEEPEPEDGAAEGAGTQWGAVLFGDASSPLPTAAWALDGAADSICFVPATSGKWGPRDMATTAPRKLLLLGSQLELSLLAETEKEDDVGSVAGATGSEEDISAFEALYGTSLPKRKPEAHAAQAGKPEKRATVGGEEGVFGGTPSHALPPLAKLFGHFMAKMLPAKAEASLSGDTPTAAANGTEAAHILGEGEQAVGREAQKALRRGEKRMLKHIEAPERVYEAFGDFFSSAQKANGASRSPKGSTPKGSPKARKKQQ